MPDPPLEAIGNQAAVVESEANCTTVDAGAGTGKTSTMLLRIERLIEAGVDPGEILVLTFANEAAASIRETIRKRLEPAVAASIDVHTYHSWCYRLVREYAYHLGRSPELEVITEHRRRRLIERLLASGDYPFVHDAAGESGIGEIAAELEGFIARLSSEDVDPDALLEGLPDAESIAVLTRLVSTLEGAAARRVTFDETALRYFSSEDHLETARAAVADYGKLATIARDHLTAAAIDHPVATDVDRYLGELVRCARRTRDALDLADSSTKHLPRVLFCNEIYGPATRRIEQTPAGRLRHYVSFLREARQHALVYRDYREAVSAAGAIDFDELVREATGLLRDPETRAGIADRWSWVCCDEFQDTDETQFTLLTALSRGEDGPSLLAIGDTDQAIYGWRGTDPTGLTRLGDEFDDHESITLERNFRSPQPILDVANCAAYDSKPLTEHDPDGDDDLVRVATVAADDVAVETPAQVARTVRLLLNGAVDGVPRRSPGDVAIVVRTNEQARRIGEALAAVQLPHAITGSPRGSIPPGMETVLSYLRVLVDPTADVHLRRVLMYRYRVGAADLARLHDHGDTLRGALDAVDADELDDPGRVDRAHRHLERLLAIRRAYPVSTVLERFLSITDIEWYLRPAERTDLERVHRFVESHERDTVLSTLSERLVDGLERSLRGSGVTSDRGARSPDRIDVMTVHQAKGLEFDTVLVPFLSDEHWCVEGDYAERSRYDLLAATLDPTVDSPLLADLAAPSVREEWRVLHVAITRAASHLVLFGSPHAYDDPEGLAVSTVDRCLPPAVEWSAAGERMDLWETVTAAVDAVADRRPGAVADWTADLETAVAERPGRISYYADYGDRSVEPLETRDAVETVHRLGWLLRRGGLLAAADAADAGHAPGGVPRGRHLESLTPETVRFDWDSLADDGGPTVALTHSHSALATHERCPRRHYLDHVVRAFDDREESTASGGRMVGTLFHDIAEEAFHRGYADRETWRAVATRQVTARDLEEHREAVLACVDRYFAAADPDVGAPVAEWEALAAELPVSLESVAGVEGPVVGYVDSVRVTPGGDLVVLDYKTGRSQIPAAEASQLALYAEALERRFDLSVDRVGYVDVGEAGPAVRTFDRAEIPQWTAVRDRLAALEDPSYGDYRPGPHCADCPHRSLGCAPADLE